MKIAVTSQGESLDSAVDPRFGRAKWFIVVDTDSGSHEAHGNSQNVDSMQGAGIQSASNVAGFGVGAVLTGHCGPKAFRALAAAGIDVFVGIEGKVGEVVERFRKGEYKPADRPDVQGHWL
jgi:predicted Fe-Mo cluster-binding NifX family protein